MKYYVGLDVSQKATAVCVVDESGKVVQEASVKSHPFEIGRYLQKRFEGTLRIGLEAGSLSAWLYRGLSGMGFEVLCLDTMQLHRTLSLNRNKTDRNDARGIAEVVRLGPQWMKLAMVKSIEAQRIKTILAARARMVRQKVDIENELCGLLKPFGFVVARGNVCAETFRDRVITVLARATDQDIELKEALVPLLDIHGQLARQIARYDAALEKQTKADPVCAKLMTVPGVGPVTALAFRAAIDDPARFKRADDVAAYLGLTPRRYQSGEIDRRGPITKRGDTVTRLHLVQAATVLLTSVKKWSSLKAWGVRLAARIGFNKAKVAVARKLACIMLAMWKTNSEFRWGKAEAASAV